MLLRFPLSSRPSDPPALPRGAREPGPTRPVDRAFEPGEADATAEVISTHNITPFVPFRRLRSAGSGKDQCCVIAGQGWGDEGGLGCRCHGNQRLRAGACRRHGANDLAISTRARALRGEDRPAADRDCGTAGTGDGRVRYHGPWRGRVLRLPALRLAY